MMETREVVIRKSDDKFYICYAKSYQSTFRNAINQFDSWHAALAHIEEYNARTVNKDYHMLYVFHPYDQSQTGV